MFGICRLGDANNPMREMKQFSVFASLLCYSFATSSTRKQLESRFWLPATAVWNTRRPYTPHQQHPSILRAAVSFEEL